jgi:hypothetical protein
MGTTVVFKPTAIQRKALALVKSGAKILLFGGPGRGRDGPGDYLPGL